MKLEDLRNLLENDEAYSEKIVAFIDVLGSKKRLYASEKPKDVIICAAWMKYFEEQSKANEDSLRISMFSDCMYVLADKKDIQTVCRVLSALAINLLFANIRYENEENCKAIDCFKLRGGITYGKIYVPNTNELASGMLLGPAIARAYELESKLAVYPRIVVDGEVSELINQQGLEKRDCGIYEDSKDGKYYLNFFRYPFKMPWSPVKEKISACIEYVDEEIKKSEQLQDKNEKLLKKLNWYMDFLLIQQAISGFDVS